MILVAYLSIGRLLIWTLQTAVPARKLYQWSSFLTELFECDFCLGMWVYLLVGLLFSVNIFPEIHQNVGIILTALAASFGAHIFMIGWRIRFGTTYIE